MRILPAILLSSIAVLALLSGIAMMVLGGNKNLLNEFVNNKVERRLDVNPKNKDAWTGFHRSDEITGPMETTFYLFNITNPQEVRRGEPYILDEIGPFVYKKYDRRENLEYAMNKQSIIYDSNVYYIFNEEKSIGHPKDFNLTMANIPLVSTLKSVEQKPTMVAKMLKVALQRLPSSISNIFIHRTADEILWGYEDPLLAALHKSAPEMVPSSYFQLQHNDTFTPENEISIKDNVVNPRHPQVLHDSSEFIRIEGKETSKCFPNQLLQGFDGRRLPVHRLQSSAHNINRSNQAANDDDSNVKILATDPFYDGGPLVYPVYLPELQRPIFFKRDVYSTNRQNSAARQFSSIRAVDGKLDKSLGLETVEFVLDDNANFASVSDFADNRNFDAHASIGGVLNLTRCNFGAPIFISQPFFAGESAENSRSILDRNVEYTPRFQPSVERAELEKSHQANRLIFELHSGVVLSADIQLQINFLTDLEHGWPSDVSPDALLGALLPLARVSNHVSLPQSRLVAMFAPLYNGLSRVNTFNRIGVPLGIVLTLAGVIISALTVILILPAHVRARVLPSCMSGASKKASCTPPARLHSSPDRHPDVQQISLGEEATRATYGSSSSADELTSVSTPHTNRNTINNGSSSTSIGAIAANDSMTIPIQSPLLSLRTKAPLYDSISPTLHEEETLEDEDEKSLQQLSQRDAPLQCDETPQDSFSFAPVGSLSASSQQLKSPIISNGLEATLMPPQFPSASGNKLEDFNSLNSDKNHDFLLAVKNANTTSENSRSNGVADVVTSIGDGTQPMISPSRSGSLKEEELEDRDSSENKTALDSVKKQKIGNGDKKKRKRN